MHPLPTSAAADIAYLVGADLTKSASDATPVYDLAGRLYLSRSGWILLSVPNSLLHGAFDALDEHGLEKPAKEDGSINAHISVMRPEEVEKLGGPDKITERGHTFHYTLGPIKTVEPKTWGGVSKVWYITVFSPELRKLRRAYGLSSQPNEDWDFHITVAVRKTGVLGSNETSKAAEVLGLSDPSAAPEAFQKEGQSLYVYTGGGHKPYFEPDLYEHTDYAVFDSVNDNSKSAEEAKGIPSRAYYGDLSKLEPGMLDYVVQRHLARRAGPHFDVRFGDPKGLFSWVTRKGMPGPGGRVLLKQQPMHSYKYKDFEGTIPQGQYGAGDVKTHDAGKIMVTSVSPSVIHFTLANKKYPERFVMVRPERWGDKDWLLINATPQDKVPYDKVRYKRMPADQVDQFIQNMQQGDSVEAKMDGASSLIKLLKDGVEVVSYRTSKETGRPIIHTEKLLGGLPKMKIPKELVGTVLKGETYGTQGDRVLEPQELGGVLNSTLSNAMDRIAKEKLKLKNMVYDVQQYGDKHIDWNTVPRAERRQMIQQVLQHLPQDTFHISEAATDPASAQELWTKIKNQQHPLTNEGVVIHPQHGTPIKSKLLEDSDVHIKNIFPGEGKYQGVGAGGFEYANEPTGPIVGRVGTGFSDSIRQDMLKNPKDYVGRVARIRSQSQYQSGAHRAPAFLALHEDQ